MVETVMLTTVGVVLGLVNLFGLYLIANNNFYFILQRSFMNARKKSTNKHMLNIHHIDDELFIYQRSDVASLNWYAHIKLVEMNRPKHRTLGTTSQKKAIKEAKIKKAEFQKSIYMGTSFTPITFREATEKYLTWLKDEVDNGYKKKSLLDTHRYLSKYMLEYFSDIIFEEIREKEFDEYVSWRKVYHTRGPGSKQKKLEYVRNGKLIEADKPQGKAPSESTLNKENVVFRAILKFAKKRRLVSSSYALEIENHEVGDNRRPSFTDEEMDILEKLALKRYMETKNARNRYYRGLLYGFLLLLKHTGMRPGEAMRLEWGDIQYQDTHILINIKEYKRKKRKFVASLSIDKIFTHVRNLYGQVNAETMTGNVFSKDSGYIFRNPSGEQIQSFKKGFRDLLEAAGLLYDDEGNRRQAYSLRHYHASKRLKNDISGYFVSKNMGTSPQMLERHYDHVIPENIVEELINVDDQIDSLPSWDEQRAEWEEMNEDQGNVVFLDEREDVREIKAPPQRDASSRR